MSLSVPTKAASPSRAKVIVTICRQTGLGPYNAGETVDWLETKVIVSIRQNNYQPYHPTTEELAQHHEVLTLIMPHGALSRPGSAHFVLEQYLLNIDRRFEHALIHEATGNAATPCEVEIRLIR